MNLHRPVALSCGLLAIAALLALRLTRPSSLEAGTAVRLEIEQLAQRSELVVEGRVLSTRAFRDARGDVRTEFLLSVDATHAGEPLGTRRFELPGGVLADGSGTLIAGMPTLALGEDALLFLTGESASGLRVPVGLAQGKLRLVRDAAGRLGLLRDAAELTLLDPVSGLSAPAPSPSMLDHADVVRRVRSARARGEAR
ncbi:MAG: hypothetical protein FJ298_01130 [Planctomycetes bacterium]|nr:hypothetical protein [Planctomycetota bacterium]